MAPPDGLIAFRISDGLIAVNRPDGFIDVNYRFRAPTLDSQDALEVAIPPHHEELRLIKPLPSA